PDILELLHVVDPPPPRCYGGTLSRLDQFAKRDFRIAEQGNGVGVMATELFRIDVELDDWRPRSGQLPVERDLASRVAADEEGGGTCETLLSEHLEVRGLLLQLSEVTLKLDVRWPRRPARCGAERLAEHVG